MQGHRFSAYEYLSFIFPGLTLAATIVYGWNGWPYGEPGVAALLGIVSAGFVLGHLVTAVANWLAPIYWGDKPGSRVASSQGLLGKNGPYNEEEWKRVEAIFAQLHPQLASFENRFRVEYSLALKGELGSRLQTFVDQIGFHRAMATASIASCVAVIALAMSGRDYLPPALWGPAFALAAIAFAARYRRFWTRLGDYVVREAVMRTEGSSPNDPTSAPHDN